jgi:hypothetical protein
MPSAAFMPVNPASEALHELAVDGCGQLALRIAFGRWLELPVEPTAAPSCLTVQL